MLCNNTTVIIELSSFCGRDLDKQERNLSAWENLCISAPDMQICGVCNGQIPKYRCPACKIRYCSLTCYKKHKDVCVSVEQAASSMLPEFKGTQIRSGEWTVEDILDEEDELDRVPLESLKKLGESEELKDLLRNPHLRQLLLTVDQAESKADIMKIAMQEPLFVEFADRSLKIVEPEDKEDILEQ